MEGFWKAAAVMILAVILGTAIGRTEKDLASALSVVACCIILTRAMHYLSEVFVFLRNLGSGAGEQTAFADTLLRLTGVALVTEITALIGADSGNQSMGKAIQILGNAVMLCLSLPIFESFLSLIRELLEYL